MHQKKILLDKVTLVGIDCLDIERISTAAQISTEHIEFADVKILSSIQKRTPFPVVRIDPIRSTVEYSHFCITKLTEFVHTPHVLIIHHDGFILNPLAWEDSFLQYDYIGAPWQKGPPQMEIPGYPERDYSNYRVGNGGFSLRSKRFLDACTDLWREGKIPNSHPEDMVICIYLKEALEKRGMRFAPEEVARKFSIEGWYHLKHGYCRWNGQFGFHSLTLTDISRWTKRNRHWEIKNPYKRRRFRIRFWRDWKYKTKKTPLAPAVT